MPQPKPRGASDSRWARWRRLSSSERRATMVAAALIPLVAGSLRTLGVHRTLTTIERRRLGRLSADHPVTPAAGARDLARAVSRASRHGAYAGNCLSRSLTLLCLLRWSGIVGELRFGARTTNGRFAAHAWVEHEGRVLNDSQDVGARFSPFRSHIHSDRPDGTEARAADRRGRRYAPAVGVPGTRAEGRLTDPGEPPAIADLLLACLHQDRSRFDGVAAAAVTRTEWNALVDYAAQQRVRPLLYRRLTAPDIEPHVPAAALAELRAACRQIALRNLRALGELAAILRSLNEADIPAVVLKGAYLAQHIYGSAALREMHDLDILVHRADLDRAFGLVRSRGYAAKGASNPAAQSAVRQDAPKLVRRATAIVEIHWNITPPLERYAIDPGELWTRTVAAAMGGVPARAFGTEDLLLHLSLHASYHHGFDFGLRPFCDLAAVLAHCGDRINWTAVQERAQRWGWDRGVYLTLRLATELVGAAVPAHALELLRPPDVDDSIVSAARSQTLSMSAMRFAGMRNVAKLTSDRSLGWRIRYARSRLFLSGIELANAYPRLPRRLRFIGHLLRPFTMAWRYGAVAARLLLANETALAAAAARQNQLRRWMQS